jgi:hypothetical protein
MLLSILTIGISVMLVVSEAIIEYPVEAAIVFGCLSIPLVPEQETHLD